MSPTACLDLADLDNFDLLQRQNFSPRLNTGQFNSESIIQAISAYDPDRIAAVTAAVRSKCTLHAATDALEALYTRQLRISAKISVPSSIFKDELHAMANYIQSVMPMVRDRERLLAENTDIRQVIAVRNRDGSAPWMQLDAHNQAGKSDKRMAKTCCQAVEFRSRVKQGL